MKNILLALITLSCLQAHAQHEKKSARKPAQTTPKATVCYEDAKTQALSVASTMQRPSLEESGQLVLATNIPDSNQGNTVEVWSFRATGYNKKIIILSVEGDKGKCQSHHLGIY